MEEKLILRGEADQKKIKAKKKVVYKDRVGIEAYTFIQRSCQIKEA